MTDLMITGARVVTPDGIVERDVTIRGGKVRLAPAQAAKGRRRAASRKAATAKGGGRRRPEVQRIDARGRVLLPGFVDIHTHGHGGFDVVLGVYDAARDRFEGSRRASLAALGDYVGRMTSLGVTTAFLATMAAEERTLRRRLRLLDEFLQKPPAGARIAGVFLEGTFISDTMLGAMNRKFVHPPDVRLFDRINETGLVKLALVAPESGAAARKLIRHMSRRGVVPGAGHTDASADQLRAARRAGLAYMVHFLNGPTGHNFKSFGGGGTVEGALSDDTLPCEIIADGYHVDPRYVRDVIARKGPDRVIAISDSMFPAGVVVGPGRFKSFTVKGVRGTVGPGGKYLHVAGKPNVLFGSCLDMPTAFGNLVSWLTRPMDGIWVRRHEALSPDDALVAVAKMAATNPARLTGLDRSLGIGRIASGRAADLVLARLDGKPGAYTLSVERTWSAGREVFAEE